MKINMKSAGRVVIDGREFNGGTISIVNGVVTVDGKKQCGVLTGNINVTVHGDVETLENGSGKVCAKNVHKISTGSGDVFCQDVSGSISTGSGDVECESVYGSVKTGSGDIRHR